MTVSSTALRADAVGNGSTATFPFTFPVQAASELTVITRDLAGVETALVYTTDYTVTLATSGEGGDVVLTAGNLTSGYAIAILPNEPTTQETSVRNQGAYFPDQAESDLDRAAIRDKQLQEQADRALHLPRSEAGTAAKTTLPFDRASSYLAFDSNKKPIASQGPSSVPVSAAMTPIVNAATVADARAALAVALVYDATNSGADPLGVVDATTVVQAMLDAISAAGGGRAIFTGGRFLITATLVVQAGVEVWCEDDGTLVYTGATRALKFLGAHKHEHHRIRIDFTGNANANVDAIDIWQGLSRSVLDAYLKVTSAVRHGIVLHGIDPTDGVTANNNQYSNEIRLRSDNSSTPTGVGVYLKGVSGTANSYCNANLITGNVDFPTSVRVIGNGNRVVGLIINAAATAGVSFTGAGTYGNLIEGCYFDSGMGGPPVLLEDSSLANNPVFVAVMNQGLPDESKVTNSTGSNDVHYSILSNYSLVLQRSSFGAAGAHIYTADASSDKTLDIREGLDNADARLVLAGKAFAGATNKVSDKGGASVALFSEGTNTAEFRIVRTTNGATWEVLGQFKCHPVMGLGYKQAAVGGGSAGGGYTYDGPATNPPASGTYAFGDVIRNNNPSLGDCVGIVCRTGGTPGTWEPFGQIGFRTNAGSPAAAVTPKFAGEELFDSTNSKWYKSHGTANTAWTQLTN